MKKLFTKLYIVNWLIIVCVLFSCSNSANNLAESKAIAKPFRVIAFYKGPISDIEKYDYEKITHLVFSFTHLKGNKMVLDSTLDENILIKLISLKKEHRNLKVLISFGGWGGCETCSDTFSTQKNREEFAKSARDMIVKYGADGLDMDWESPVIGGYKNHPASKDDKENFTALMRELRKTLPPGSELCFDANSFKECLEQSVDWNEVIPLVDFVNLMTYTLPNNLSKHTGHHTALYSSLDQTESAEKAMRYLDSIHVPLNKIIIGAAFYGIVSENVDSIHHGLYRPGKYKADVTYKKLEEKYLHNPDYSRHWDSITQAPYLYSSKWKQFISYDDCESVRLKTKYTIEKELGGIMFWRLNGDLPKDGLLDCIYKEFKSHK